MRGFRNLHGLGLFLATAIVSGLAWAETLEMVTYYPAPSAAAGGDLDRLHANRATIGDAYNRTNVPDADVPDGQLFVFDRLGIGTTAPAGPLHVVGVDDATSSVVFMPGVDTAAAGVPAIRVGIGTSTPNQQLELTGNLRIPHTTNSVSPANNGILYKDSDPFLHDRGSRSVFLGVEAGNLNNGGVENMGIGYQVMRGLITGARNVAVGSGALDQVNTGSTNVALGFRPLFQVTSGSSNIGIGSQALENIKTGARNVAIGSLALNQLTGGNSSNVAIGEGTMKAATAGNFNVAVGAYAMEDMPGGIKNVVIGYQAGHRTGLPSGDGNIYIGYQAGYSATGSDKLYIDNSNTNSPLIYGDFANRLVGIGTSSPSTRLTIQNPGPGGQNTLELRDSGDATGDASAIVWKNASGTQQASIFQTGAGNSFRFTSTGPIFFNAGATGFTTASERMIINTDGFVYANVKPYSDATQKTDVQPLGDVLNRVIALQGITYRWKDKDMDQGKEMGFIAQDVEKVFPELVRVAPNGLRTVAYDHLTAALVEAIRELKDQKDSLEAQVKELREEVSSLKQAAASSSR